MEEDAGGPGPLKKAPMVESRAEAASNQRVLKKKMIKRTDLEETIRTQAIMQERIEK